MSARRSGSLLDRFGSSPLLTVGVSLVTASAFLYAWTPNYNVLVLAQVVMALGASFGFVGAGYIRGVWFPAASFGLKFGLVQAFASLGSALGQPAISFLLRDMTWNSLLAGFGVFGVILVVLFALLVRNPRLPGEQFEQSTEDGELPLVSGILGDLGTCFRNRQVVLASLMAGVSWWRCDAHGREARSDRDLQERRERAAVRPTRHVTRALRPSGSSSTPPGSRFGAGCSTAAGAVPSFDKALSARPPTTRYRSPRCAGKSGRQLVNDRLEAQVLSDSAPLTDTERHALVGSALGLSYFTTVWNVSSERRP